MSNIRKILLCITYLGTAYHGWQVQANAPTVQQTVQDAIEKIFCVRYDLTGCSRTDSGVHANNYYCCFCPESRIKTENIAGALNAVLPDDIAVKSAAEVPQGFHPRYSVTEKEYIYLIRNASVRDPFSAGRAVQIGRMLDEIKMNRAAEHFLGKHDFSAFCAAGSSVNDNVRTVKSIGVTRSGETVKISVSADGFLYNMVRIIAGTLIAVGDGSLDGDRIPSIIESRMRQNAGVTAPPQGLYLNRVEYGENLI